ncbi:MAG: HAMP domain-containing protein [bacterium]|nr:MAG: HAMP domain-containing protein [bacterium]
MVYRKILAKGPGGRRQLGLRFEIMFSLGLIMFSGVVIMGATALRAAEKTILLQKLESLTHVTRAVQLGLTGWWSREGPTGNLQVVLNQTAAGVGVSSFKVVDQDRRILAGVKSNDIGRTSDPFIIRALETKAMVVPGQVTGKLPESAKGSWTFAAPVFREGVLVGAFSVAYPLENLGITLSLHRKLVYTFALIDGLMIVLFGGWLIGRIALGPMVRISKGAEAFAAGQYDARVQIQGPREIVALAEAFNSMAERIQAAVRKQEEHLAALETTNRELVAAQREMVRVEKLASVGHLASGIAHEIGNPLSAILGYASILQREEKDPEAVRYLEYIEKETERIQRIIRGLLEFSRPRDVQVEDLNVNRLIQVTIDLVSPQNIFRDVEISLDVSPDDPVVSGDRHQLQQVFINILINAAQAMEGEGRLEIRTESTVVEPGEGPVPRRRITDFARRADDPEDEDFAAMRRTFADTGGLKTGDRAVSLAFRDSGSGIAPEVAQRIFDPFFTTKGPGEGTGLGLAIAHGIVEAHGGRIWIENPGEQGAIFRILLPEKTGER